MNRKSYYIRKRKTVHYPQGKGQVLYDKIGQPMKVYSPKTIQFLYSIGWDEIPF